MAKLSIVEGGKIVNQIIGEPGDFPDYIDHTDTPYGVGWTDNGDGTFSPPATVRQPYGEIPTGDFAQLFTRQQRIELRSSADPIIDDFIYLMERKTGEAVSLDSPELQGALNYFAQSNDVPSFSAADVTRILNKEKP